MSRVFMVLMLAACAYGAMRHFGVAAGSDIRIEGQTVHADIDGFKASYGINGPARETYMLMGGNMGGSSFAQAQFSGAELQSMRHIQKRYPDFHRCDSAGAPEVRRVAETINVVADGKTLNRFGRAMRDALSRDQLKTAERLCADVEGEWLTLEQVERDGTVITGEQYYKMIPARAFKQYFLHLRAFRTRDCKDAL